MVIDSIRYDHSRQLADNLLAGFVKRLDQQFSRAELYLFELLQNAVDEGARRVSFEIRGDSLVFQHDGDAFNASDVLGLSAVGATGKSGRTIGFMGLGFKSVYSRFERVLLSDGQWFFGYERPNEGRDGGWKFLPQWYDEAAAPEDGFKCRFDFSRTRGRASALVDDLSKLDDVVPVLLARRSIDAVADDWVLNWNGRVMRVTREPDGPSAVVLIAADPVSWPRIRFHLEQGTLKLYCRRTGVRRGEWITLPGVLPVWNDAPQKAACLRSSDEVWIEAWMSRTQKSIDENALPDLLGIARLSGERFFLEVLRLGETPLIQESRRLAQIIRAVRAIHEGDEISAATLSVFSSQSIVRKFRIDDGLCREEDLDADWDGHERLFVVGDQAAAWATDLRPLVQQALGLGANARALRLLDLIPLLDSAKNFERKFDQICRELDVPIDAIDTVDAQADVDLALPGSPVEALIIIPAASAGDICRGLGAAPTA